MVRTKKPWVRFRGEGGGEFVRIIRKKVRIICTQKSRAKYTKKLFLAYKYHEK